MITHYFFASDVRIALKDLYHLLFNFKKRCYKYHEREFENYEAFYFKLSENGFCVIQNDKVLKTISKHNTHSKQRSQSGQIPKFGFYKNLPTYKICGSKFETSEQAKFIPSGYVLISVLL